MSDQDFFFDEEEAAEKPAKTSKSAPSRGTSKASPASAKTAKPQPKPRETEQAASPIFEQSVSMTVAALMTVIGLLVGVIIGFLIPSGADVGTPQVVDAATGGMGTGQAAPELTEDQINAGMPANHPAVPGVTTTTPAPGN